VNVQRQTIAASARLKQQFKPLLPPCPTSQEVEERDSLVQLVNAQATEIERVKAQILALRCKDTSVYT
jgi:hypothetical protein